MARKTNPTAVINHAIEELVEMGLVVEVDSDNDTGEEYALSPSGAVLGHFLWNQTFRGGMTSISGIQEALSNYGFGEENALPSRQYRTARTNRRIGA